MVPNPINNDGIELKFQVLGRKEEYVMSRPNGNMKNRIRIVNGINHPSFFGFSF
jgi:hypothetical protein